MLRTHLLDEYKTLISTWREPGPIEDRLKEIVGQLTPREQFYLDHYYACIAEGTSPILADMLASQTPPQANTDATFLAGRWNQFEKTPHLGDYRRAVAESHGQMTKGKVYEPQLAAFPGDPEAWIDGRGDFERVCRKRGWGCEGAVNVPVQGAGRLDFRKRKPLAQKLYEAGVPIASE